MTDPDLRDGTAPSGDLDGGGGETQDTALAEDTAAELEDTDVDAPVEEDTAVVVEADPAPAEDCDHTSDLVYVLSRDDSRLYTFDPSTLDFTSLGVLNCGTSQQPGSMAVDRTGIAWVRYADDSLYEVELATLTCTQSTYSDRRTGFGSFGMGYATDDAETWRDQLYVANANQLATLDPATWTLSTLGRLPSQSELTGNADGELWAMLPLENPAKLVELDKGDASVLATISLPNFPNPSNIDAFAFATWNGAFYLFVREYGMGSSTDVYEVTAIGKMSKVRGDIGFDVIGAGVSTCAPV